MMEAFNDFLDKIPRLEDGTYSLIAPVDVLRAFVQEVRMRHSLDGIHHDMKPAFDELVRDFGLDAEEKP